MFVHFLQVLNSVDIKALDAQQMSVKKYKNI